MNLRHWQRKHRVKFIAAIVFGACIGAVAGIRRIDASVNQDFYWLFLGLWVGSGAMIGAVVAFVRQLMRR